MGLVDEEAEAERERAATADPLIRAFRQLAYRHLQKERYADAEKLFRVLLRRRPEEPDFMLGLGWTILRDQEGITQDRLAEARTNLRRACTRAPYNADARYCMAMCYLACGYHRRVLDELQAALRSDPGHVLAREALEKLQGDTVRGRSRDASSSGLSRALRALSEAVSKMG
ncbi:MAG: Tfp pilus assembly protein PilF [Myxococcota bacterium]|jgi:Tfp pilus assembly protein PilF